MAVAIALAFVASSCGSGGDGAATGDKAVTEVRVAYSTSVTNPQVRTLPECTKKNGVTTNLVFFQQFADVQRSLQANQADFAAMGYQNMAQLIDGGYSDFKVVAGLSAGAMNVTVATGEKIPDWKALEGKTIGVPPNSLVDMEFKVTAEENGADTSKMKFVPFPGAGPPMLAALQKHDIDAMAIYEPFSAQAKAQGIGDYALPLKSTELGNVTTLLYATDKVVSEHADAVKVVVKCIVEGSKKYEADPAAWAALLVKSGLSQEIADGAIKTGSLPFGLDDAAAAKVIKAFADRGLVKDKSSEVPKHFDYTFLEDATGQSAADLGKSG